MELQKLQDKFPAQDIEWRLQSAGETGGKIWGRALAYVTNRAIQNRLDEVCGPENWKNEFCSAPDGGVLCGISILVNGEWVTKYDGAANTNIEAVKGGLSGAMKRAAVQWGIGRYLYSLDESFVEVSDNGKMSGKTKDGKWFKWNPPHLPTWALPENPDLDNKKRAVEDYLNAGFLTGKYAEKAEKHLQTNNYEGLCGCIQYCKSLEEGNK